LKKDSPDGMDHICLGSKTFFCTIDIFLYFSGKDLFVGEMHFLKETHSRQLFEETETFLSERMNS